MALAVWVALGCGGGKAAAPDAGQTPSSAQVRQDAPPPEANMPDGWTLPNYDYDNTRKVMGSRITRATIGQLQEAWTLALTGASPFGYVTSNPLIAGDTVYVQDMGSTVYAIARDSGQLRWQHMAQLSSVGPNGVALGWGRLFADYGDTGIMALDVRSGEELWRFSPKLVQSEGVDIQPIVYGGSVFVSTVPANLHASYLGGSRGIISALDVLDGHVRWSFDTVDSPDAWGDPEHNGGGGAWYPPLIDAERGMTYWGTGNPLPWPDAATRPGPNLYTSSLVALDLHTGALSWFHQEKPHDLFDWDFQNSPVRVRPAAGGSDRELILGSGKTGTVVALDPTSGSLLWRAKVGRHEHDDATEAPGEGVDVYPGALGGVLTPLAYADGVVYVPVIDLATQYTDSFSPDILGGKGELVALSVHDGSQLWSASLPAPCYGAATVVNDLVLTSDGNGRVYAFARDNGEEVWHYDAPTGINAPLAAAGDLLLIPAGMNTGSLIALRLPGG